MKIHTNHRNQSGMAVIVVIAFLAILLIFVAGNLRMLHLLRNDLKLIEHQQTNRLARAGMATNSPASNSGRSAEAGSSEVKPRP